MLQVWLLLPCLFLIASFQQNIEKVEYGNCEGSPEQLTIEFLDIQPFPVVFASYKSIYVRAMVDLLTAIPEGATVSFKFVLEGLIPITIPCLDTEVWGLIGSCTYDGEEFLSKFAGYLCPDGPCLPILPGQYGDQNTPTVLTLPEIPDILCPYFTSQTVRMEFSIQQPDGSETACIYVRIETSEDCTPGPDITTTISNTPSTTTTRTSTTTPASGDGPHYGICEGADTTPLSIEFLDFDPYPIQIKTDGDESVRTMIHLFDSIPDGVMVQIDILKLGLIDVPIPCFEFDEQHFGSCTYDGDEFLKMFSEFLCPGGDEALCSLPIQPGWYGSSTPTKISLGQLCQFSGLLDWAGSYTMTVHLILENGSEMTCVFFTVEVEDHC